MLQSWWRAERLWRLKEEFGETDEKIGERHGWSKQYVHTMRSVWAGFGQSFEVNSGVDFKHCKTAMAWPDADECLEWAAENNASVPAMKAWRKAIRKAQGLDFDDDE